MATRNNNNCTRPIVVSMNGDISILSCFILGGRIVTVDGGYEISGALTNGAEAVFAVYSDYKMASSEYKRFVEYLKSDSYYPEDFLFADAEMIGKVDQADDDHNGDTDDDDKIIEGIKELKDIVAEFNKMWREGILSVPLTK